MCEVCVLTVLSPRKQIGRFQKIFIIFVNIKSSQSVTNISASFSELLTENWAPQTPGLHSPPPLWKRSFCHGLSGGSRGSWYYLCFPPVFLPSPAPLYLCLDLWAWQQQSHCYINPVMSPLRRQIVPPVTLTKSRKPCQNAEMFWLELPWKHIGNHGNQL